MLVDSHCHLNFKAFADNWPEVVDEAVAAGVEKIIIPGTDVATSKRAVEMAEAHPALYAAVGIHPHHAKKYMQQEASNMQHDLEEIVKLSKHPKVVAIGEVGLDKHEYKNSKYANTHTEDDFEIQKDLLLKQIELAKSFDKPLILHSRDIRDEVLDMVKDKNVRGVFHCFEGSRKYLKRILAAGFYISFTGNITFIPDRSDVALDVPLARLLLETDAPYMTPEPLRGIQNSPKNVQLIAEHHAAARGVALEEISQATSQNARQLFSLE